MESTAETVSNAVTEKSQCVDGQFQPSNPSVMKIVEEVSEDVEKNTKEDEDYKVAEQDDAKRENLYMENEPNASNLTEHEEDTKSEGNSVIEKTTENLNGTQMKIVEEVPCTATIITTPTEEKNYIEKKDVYKEKDSEIEQKEKHEEMSDEEYEEKEDVEEEKKAELEVIEKVNKTLVNEKETSKQNINEQIQPSETPQQKERKEETIVDAALTAADTNKSYMQTKQDNVSNTLKNIISTIDSNIIAEENIAALKEKEVELIKKQQELSKEIQKQQLLAQKLASENQLKQEQINNNYKVENNENIIFHNTYQPINNVSKYSTCEEKQDENVYTRTSETFESRESSDVSKKIDLNKIFTPATDAEEILPKNRKLYASSAFYSPTLHPTVEDQVELARRISHSLSDISNQQSRGQSMYVNRKKRSVKWIHEGCGRDYHKSHQQPIQPTSPSIFPANTDATKQRIQSNFHQDQLIEKYAKPDLKVVQTPRVAAFSSGSANTVFAEQQKLSPYSTSASTPLPTPQMYNVSKGLIHQHNLTTAAEDDHQKFQITKTNQLPQVHYDRQQYVSASSQRELAYKPSIPQGWKAPSMSLSKDLYMPKEIPIQSYAAPPVTPILPSESNYSSIVNNDIEPSKIYKTLNASSKASYFVPGPAEETKRPSNVCNTFPITKPHQQGFSSIYGSSQPPKQQYLAPEIYQTVPQNSNQKVLQVSFSPSPLPYDKLAKFENPSTDDIRNITSRNYQLNVRSNKVHNTSPAPSASSYHRPCTPSSETYNCGSSSNKFPQSASSYGRNINNCPTNNTSNLILNARTYNNLARGWGCSDNNSGYRSYQNQNFSLRRYPNVVNASSVPYTDF